jgi:hypothetical protein
MRLFVTYLTVLIFAALATAQGSTRKLVVPEDHAGFLAILETVKSVQMRATPASATRMPLTLSAASQESLLATFAEDMPVANPSCSKDTEYQIEFQLNDGEYMVARVRDAAHIDIIGTMVVEFVVGEQRFLRSGLELGEILQPYIQRLGRGVFRRVRSRAEIQNLAASLDAQSETALKLEGIRAADLALISGMPKLVALDVSQLELTGNGLLKLSCRDQIQVLLLSARQVVDGAWLKNFRSLHTLRVISAPALPKKEVMGRRCAGCHKTQPRPQLKLPDSGALVGLQATRRVRHLEILGVNLDLGLCKILGDLPFLETIDLSGCDLQQLDFSVFRRLSALRRLNLDRCIGLDATDLKSLEGLRNLETIYLRGVEVEANKALHRGRDVRF